MKAKQSFPVNHSSYSRFQRLKGLFGLFQFQQYYRLIVNLMLLEFQPKIAPMSSLRSQPSIALDCDIGVTPTKPATLGKSDKAAQVVRKNTRSRFEILDFSRFFIFQEFFPFFYNFLTLGIFGIVIYPMEKPPLIAIHCVLRRLFTFLAAVLSKILN